MNSTRKQIPQAGERFWLILAALAVLVIAFLAYVSGQSFRRNSDQASVTRQEVDDTNALLSALTGAETGQRGFLLTGDDRYLDPYRQALTQIPPLLNQLARVETERHRTEQTRRVEQLRPLVTAKLEELDQTIVLRRSQGLPAALAIVQTGRGMALMVQIRAVCSEIQKAAYVSSGQATAQARRRGEQLAIIAVVGSLAIFIVLVFATLLVERGTRRRQELIEALQASEDRLRESRDWLQVTLASIGDAVISTDAGGNVAFLNPVAEQVTGWTSEEAAGKPLERVFIIRNEETGREVENPVTKVLREGRVVGLANHTTLIAKSGNRIPIDDSAAPIRNSGGTTAGVVMVFRDVSAQRRAQAVSRLLASIVESADDAIIGKDLNGTITTWNGAAERIFGYSVAEAVGQPISMLAPPGRGDEMSAIMARIRSGDKVEHFETVRKTKQGDLLDISLTVSPVYDAAGQIVGASKIVRDITGDVRARAEIAELADRLRITLGSIGDAVIATDANGTVNYLNPVAEGLTGWPLSEATGKLLNDVFKIVNEETREAVENPVSKVLREERVVGLGNHTVLIARNGQERAIDDSGSPIRSRDGRIVGVVLVFRDVSERRRAELERQSAALERERLHEAERVARAEAERANRVKDEFVAMVSHELRTPLNAILGWTHLMVMPGAEAETIARGLDVISRNTRMQARLISDLLDISRIAAGKVTLEIEPVALASTLTEAVDTIQPEADDKHITIRRDFEGGADTIAGDAARVKQIVWNLLSNAIKFTPEGGEVTVRLRRIGRDAEITVADTGIGIEAEFLPHIFEQFQQADPSITRSFGGLGLGLSIAKRLVELHGGSISAESAGKGQGATFAVVLPAGAEEHPPSTAVVDWGTEAALPRGLLSGIRIFVVEDEPDTIEFLDRFLGIHGASVTTAPTAAHALSSLANDRVDIVISDIGLPDVDGYELMRRIRRLPAERGGATPAIALTAYVRTEDRTRALQAGYQAHLAKPIEPAELFATISNFAELINVRRPTAM